MRSFRNSESWTLYRRILDEEFGIGLDLEPEEIVRDLLGHAVRIDHWSPAEAAKGTLILVHGGGGNGRILAPFAEPIARCGWRILAPDLPGYGLTMPRSGYRGDYGEWPAVIAALADAEGSLTVLMGLSMGGLTAVLAAQAARAVSGVIATTLLDLSDPGVFIRSARAPWLGRLTLLGMAAAPCMVDRIALPLSWAAPLGAMSANERLRAYFANDPLIGKAWKTARFFRTAHQQPIRNWALGCPLLLVHPGHDAWTPTASSRAVFERIEAWKSCVELSGGSHLPVEAPAHGELIAIVGRFLDAVGATKNR